jgi:hypothetical protein
MGNEVGRPSKLTDDIVSKLEQCFSIDATVTEACYYCDISRDTFYQWMKENPELSDRLERLRSKPILKARQEVVKGIENDKEFALKYLNKKKRDEFGDKLDLTHGGEVSYKYQIEIIDGDNKENTTEQEAS